MNLFKTVATAAMLTTLPFAAFAAPANLTSVDISLTPSGYSNSYTVSAVDDGVIFNFNILEDLYIPFFSLSSTAPSGGSDTTMYEITFPSTGPSAFGIINMATLGGDIVPGTHYQAGDAFSTIFTETSSEAISYTVSFGTEISAVPVPASGLLLLTAFGGVAAMRRKKAKS